MRGGTWARAHGPQARFGVEERDARCACSRSTDRRLGLAAQFYAPGTFDGVDVPLSLASSTANAAPAELLMIPAPC